MISRRGALAACLAGPVLVLTTGCSAAGPDADRLNEVVRGVPGVTGSSLTVERAGSGRSVRGTVDLPDGTTEARTTFDEALRALSAELGGDPPSLGIYVEGRSASGTLTTADVGAPLNPSSVGLWEHYHGG